MKPINITDATFVSEVVENDSLVLVDFWAPWCGPCRAIAPVLDETAANWGDRVKVVKINVDENRNTAADFGVTSIPTLIFFREGRVVDRMTGWIPLSQLSRKIGEHLVRQAVDQSPAPTVNGGE